MGWDIELAKELKKRDNQPTLGNIVGKVVSLNPLKIMALDGLILLEKESLYLADGTESFNYDVGTEVLLAPTSDNQNFFIISKAIKL